MNALVDQYDWQSLPEGPVVDVGGAEGSTSLVLAKVGSLAELLDFDY